MPCCCTAEVGLYVFVAEERGPAGVIIAACKAVNGLGLAILQYMQHKQGPYPCIGNGFCLADQQTACSYIHHISCSFKQPQGTAHHATL
jgi:hypothetical protein